MTERRRQGFGDWPTWAFRSVCAVAAFFYIQSQNSLVTDIHDLKVEVKIVTSQFMENKAKTDVLWEERLRSAMDAKNHVALDKTL